MSESPLVAVIMGSTSDWDTMQHCDNMLMEFEVPRVCHVVSAHRTPDWMREFAHNAEAQGVEVVIAGAGGAAHLPGMVAAQTTLPVLGVPVQSRVLNGVDSLLSIVQMPAGIPVGTLAIGAAGAKNAALLAVSILANKHEGYKEKLEHYRTHQTETVMGSSLPTSAFQSPLSDKNYSSNDD